MLAAPILASLLALGLYTARSDAARVAESGSEYPARAPRLAVINTLHWHYECIGHVLEFARAKGIQVDVFMHHGDVDGGTGWAALYGRLGLLGEVYAVASFAGLAARYTHVFAMNEADLAVAASAGGPAIACLLHTPEQAPRDAQWHIYVRPHVMSAAQWVVPAHALCSRDEKLRAMSRATSVALVGSGWQLPIARLREIFANFDDLEVHIVCRSTVPEARSTPNVRVYEKATAGTMLAVVMRAHYVAVPLGGHGDRALLGVSLALGTGTRLIVSAALGSPLVVERVPPLGRATTATVDAAFADLERAREHRDVVYTAMLLGDGRGIPKIRFCTGPFKVAEMPDAFASILRAEQALSPDHEIRYFDHDDCDRFVGLHFPQLAPHYRNLIPGAFRADVWRLMALYTHGGVYADLAARFAAPMSALFRPSDRLVVCVDTPTDSSGICNGLIAARPNSPALRFAIEHIVRTRLEPRDAGSYSLDITGPKALGRAMSLFFRGADDGAAFVPGDYGTHRVLNYENPRVVDERGGVVVRTFKFEGYYDAMYASRKQKHYWPLWRDGCVFRDRSPAGCELGI